MSLDPDDPVRPDLLSHPANDGEGEMVLERHLCGVAARARSVTPDDATTVDGRSLQDAAEIVGLAHDFGKATDWFQQSLDDDRSDSDPLTYHARLGAFVAYYALAERGYDSRACFAGFVAVAKHHGDLPNASKFVEDEIFGEDRWGNHRGGLNHHARRQAAKIDETASDFARAVFGELLDGGLWTEFRDAFGPDSNDDGTLRGQIRDSIPVNSYGSLIREFDADTYLDELRLYGALTFADKTHAAGVEDNDDRLQADALTAKAVKDHIDDLPDADGDLESSLNDLRGAIQSRITREGGPDRVREFVESDRSVATLTLPTGYGKTLTGLLAAARIRERTGGERIVYALPFTSIVDQTADVLEGVTGESGDGSAFSVHHHLAETVTLPDDDDDSADDEEDTDGRAREDVMLAESWRAGVTLTTFVQLFESLAGPRNGQSMKLPALYGSVVIVDEPQALPLRWWPLVALLLDALVEQYDATVLLMTATQPRILPDEETYSLLPEDELDELVTREFASIPERVVYEFHSSVDGEERPPLEHDAAASELVDVVSGTTDAVMAICNTIDSAQELYDGVKTELETRAEPVEIADEYRRCVLDGDEDGGPYGSPSLTDEEGVPTQIRGKFVRHLVRKAGADAPLTLHLSTRLRPCDRQFVLAVAKDLTGEGVPFVLVSTQLVEAGVDVSFDRVFRDFAPLDCIVQAAGRCNRSFERAPERGVVTVWQLATPEGSSMLPSEAVYARTGNDTELDLLAKTRGVLQGVEGSRVSERRIARDAVDDYHAEIGGRVRELSADNRLRRDFEKANGACLRSASVIESQFSFEVYVCRTEADWTKVEKFREKRKSFEFDEAGDIKRELGSLRVSVPAYSRDSDITAKLVELEPLERERDKRDATERVLRPSELETKSFFDTAKGVNVPESAVGDRIL